MSGINGMSNMGIHPTDVARSWIREHSGIRGEWVREHSDEPDAVYIAPPGPGLMDDLSAYQTVNRIEALRYIGDGIPRSGSLWPSTARFAYLEADQAGNADGKVTVPELANFLRLGDVDRDGFLTRHERVTFIENFQNNLADSGRMTAYEDTDGGRMPRARN